MVLRGAVWLLLACWMCPVLSMDGVGMARHERASRLAAVGTKGSVSSFFAGSPCGTDRCCEAIWKVANRRDISILLTAYTSDAPNSYDNVARIVVRTADVNADAWAGRDLIPNQRDDEFRLACDCKKNAQLIFYIFSGRRQLPPRQTYALGDLPAPGVAVHAASSSDAPAPQPVAHFLASVLDGNTPRVFLVQEEGTSPFHFFVIQRRQGVHSPSFRVYSSFARFFRLVDWMSGFITMLDRDGRDFTPHRESRMGQDGAYFHGGQLLSKEQFQGWLQQLVSTYTTLFAAKSADAHVPEHDGRTVADFYRLFWTSDRPLRKDGLRSQFQQLTVWEAEYSGETCERTAEAVLSKVPRRPGSEWAHLNHAALPVAYDERIVLTDTD